MGKIEPIANRKFKVRTPGKVILTGEHAVVYGQLALAASVELTTEIFLTLHMPHNPPVVSFVLEDLIFEWTLPLIELQEIRSSLTSDGEILSRLRCVLKDRVPHDASQTIRTSLLILCFLYCTIVDHSPTGFEIRIKSTIPMGAGLGSSAAFSVGSSTVFHLLRHLITNNNPFVPNLESINHWAFQCEKVFHATPSGIDNSVCTYGGIVKYQKTVIDNISIPEARILLVNTGVARKTKLLVESVSCRRNNFPSIINPILDSIGQISERIVDVIQQSPDTSYGDIKELLSMNHWLLASLGVSHGSLDDICRIADSHRQASKLTGAGGGGLAFIWLNPKCPEEEIKTLQEELLQKQFISWLTRLGVKGVQVEELPIDEKSS